MWVCYANYNNIETTLKLEATRAPIWTGFWKTPAWKSTERTRTVDRAALGFLERAGPPVRHAD